MNHQHTKFLEKILHTPSFYQIPLINLIFNVVLPFNAPHKIRIRSISNDQVSASLPFIRKNFNHLRTIHAAAIATLGEFSAGVLLLKTFPFSSYRLIMAELNITYLFRAKTELVSRAEISPAAREELNQSLQLEGKGKITLTVAIFDTDKNLVANVRSTWQLKQWEKIAEVGAGTGAGAGGKK